VIRLPWSDYIASSRFKVWIVSGVAYLRLNIGNHTLIEQMSHFSYIIHLPGVIKLHLLIRNVVHSAIIKLSIASHATDQAPNIDPNANTHTHTRTIVTSNGTFFAHTN